MVNTRAVKQRMSASVARHLPGYDGTLHYLRVEGDWPEVILSVSAAAAEQSGLLAALRSDPDLRVSVVEGDDQTMLSIHAQARLPAPPTPGFE